MTARKLRRAIFLGALVCSVLSAQNSSSQSTSPQANGKQQVDTVVIELSRYGFFPQQVSHLKGLHFILVHNVSGLQDLTLVLKDDHGAAKKQPALTATSPHWRELLDLAPGKYTLTEANHPTWSCAITIQ